MTQAVLDAIRSTVGSRPAEQGGLLGSSDGTTIDHYHFDEHAATTGASYSPNVEALKPISQGWQDQGVGVVGFCHSHPIGHARPSQGDLDYATAILAVNDLDRLALPIVLLDRSGFDIRGYYAELHGEKVRIVDAPITIVSDAVSSHQRVESAYPLDIMRRKTLVCIGCGGAGEYIETLARTGIGRIVIFDGDSYSASNIATQQCYLDELGLNKSLAVAQRVARVDPEIKVVAVPSFLDDAMSDRTFAALVGPDLRKRPTDVLIAACTDSFWAQDRAARLAMRFGTPYLAAQLYERGLAAEALFTYPGVTVACPRCILRDRYDAYADGYENTVGSQGAPIFATQRLNALKTVLSLMLFLYKEDGTPYSGLLDEVAERNFLQIRMSPNPASPVHPLFQKYLGENPYAFFDETLWMKVTPELDCPLLPRR